jgi:hypothetical protein
MNEANLGTKWNLEVKGIPMPRSQFEEAEKIGMQWIGRKLSQRRWNWNWNMRMALMLVMQMRKDVDEEDEG